MQISTGGVRHNDSVMRSVFPYRDVIVFLFCRLAAQVIGCLNDLFEHCSAAELEELGLKDELEEGNAEFESQCLAQEQWWLSSDGKDQ